MDRYMKLFIMMSLIYFLVAGFFGVLMGVGVGDEGLRFAHIHLNLLGFMAMMIYGVGYFILPRFNARVLRWPELLPVHFWSSNVGLVGMCLTYGSSTGWFLGFGILQGLSILMFAGNLGASMFAAEQGPKEKEEIKEEVEIQPDMKVGDIVEKWPHVIPVLVEAGLKGLSDGTHIEQLKKVGVTVSMTAKRHGIDEALLTAKILEAITGKKSVQVSPVQPGGGEKGITKDSIIGDVLKKYPNTDGVFRRFYGEGCFSCPGQAFETIAQSALMHNVNEDEILKALNNAV